MDKQDIVENDIAKVEWPCNFDDSGACKDCKKYDSCYNAQPIIDDDFHRRQKKISTAS